MKILGNLGVFNNYNKDSAKASKEKSEVSPKRAVKEDKVEISQSALKKNDKTNEVEHLKTKLNALEDREAKIDSLKKGIKDGTYKVSTAHVADAIIDSKKV